MNTNNSFKWRSILGLVFIYLAMWFDWQWAWGILFLMWVIPDIQSGVTYFMEPIAKDKHVLLYWIIIMSWILLGLYAFIPLIYPEWY